MWRRLALCCALLAAGAIAPAATSGSTLDAKRHRADALSGRVSAYNARIGALTHKIVPLESRLASIQTRLDAERARLVAIQDQLRRARARLAQLQAAQLRDEEMMRRRLVEEYKNGKPDVITVVLTSHGFTELLERVQFLKRIQQEDIRVVTQVRSARAAVIRQADRLGALEARAQKITTAMLTQRNEVARIRLTLVTQRLRLAARRNAAASQLSSLRHQVAALQARIARQSASRAGVSIGGISSSGGFTFPMPKSAAVGPGSWSLDQGVDIAAPGNTPLLAVGSGTVVLHGIGGFGPSAPVLHLDSGRYVYYGHAGPGNMVPVGTHVGAGQVISEVGAGIVGISTGPHLEIGFADASGTPAPGTASTMHSLLLGAYGG